MYSSELHVDGIQFSMVTDVTFVLDDTHWQSAYVYKKNKKQQPYRDLETDLITLTWLDIDTEIYSNSNISLNVQTT